MSSFKSCRISPVALIAFLNIHSPPPRRDCLALGAPDPGDSLQGLSPSPSLRPQGRGIPWWETSKASARALLIFHTTLHLRLGLNGVFSSHLCTRRESGAVYEEAHSNKHRTPLQHEESMVLASQPAGGKRINIYSRILH